MILATGVIKQIAVAAIEKKSSGSAPDAKKEINNIPEKKASAPSSPLKTSAENKSPGGIKSSGAIKTSRAIKTSGENKASSEKKELSTSGEGKGSAKEEDKLKAKAVGEFHHYLYNCNLRNI